MRCRRWASVIALAGLLLGCVAENTTPPRDIAIDTARGRLAGALQTVSVRLHAGVLELQHAGGGNCPGVVSSIRPDGKQAVRLVLWSNYHACHADLVFYVSRIALPPSLKDEPSLKVTIHFDNGPGSVTEDVELIAYKG